MCRNEFRRVGHFNFPPLGVPVVDAFRIFCQQVRVLARCSVLQGWFFITCNFVLL